MATCPEWTILEDIEGTYTLSEHLNAAAADRPLILIDSKGPMDKDKEVQSIAVFGDGTVRNAFFTMKLADRPLWKDIAKMSDSELIEWVDQREETGEREPYFLMINTDSSGSETEEKMIMAKTDNHCFLPYSTSGSICDSNCFG